MNNMDITQLSSVVAIICSIFVSGCVGWQWCYVCSGVAEDRTCEVSPLGVQHGPKAVNCTQPYCTAVKVTYRGSNITQSFARLCEAVDRGNWCVYDPNFVTCYHTCQTNFCNDGNPDSDNLPEVTNADLQQRAIESISKHKESLAGDNIYHYYMNSEPERESSNLSEPGYNLVDAKGQKMNIIEAGHNVDGNSSNSIKLSISITVLCIMSVFLKT